MRRDNSGATASDDLSAQLHSASRVSAAGWRSSRRRRLSTAPGAPSFAQAGAPSAGAFRGPPAQPETPAGRNSPEMLDETISGNPRNDTETQRAYSSGQGRGGKSRPGGSDEPLNSLSGPHHPPQDLVVALVAGIAVAALGISARTGSDHTQSVRS